MVTCHMDTAQAFVWRLQNFVLGEHILRPCPDNPRPVKVRFAISYTVYLSLCHCLHSWLKIGHWLIYLFICLINFRFSSEFSVLIKNFRVTKFVINFRYN